MLKASAESSVAIKENPFEADSVHCPFYARFGTPIFDYYRKHPEHSGRFAKAMAGWRKSKYMSLLCLHSHLETLTLQKKTALTSNGKVVNNIVELRDNYSWADLKGTVVDIGGGSGHVSILLARVSRIWPLDAT